MSDAVVAPATSNSDPQADLNTSYATVSLGSESIVVEGSAVVIDQFIFKRKTGRQPKVWYTEVPPNLRDAPWEPLPAEFPRAYRAFLIYRDMGIKRSHRLAGQVIREPREGSEEGRLVPSSLLREWYRRFLWDVRVQAWDMEVLRRQAHVWEDRMKELRQTRWDIADKLFQKALAALDTIQIDVLTPRDVARFLQLASEMAGMTEQQPVSADDVQVFLNVLPEALRERVTGLLKEASKRIADEEQARTKE